MWFGEFIQPDWDMFQSGHRMGALHAAGRAVSGGPVYVSDKPANMILSCYASWFYRMVVVPRAGSGSPHLLQPVH